VLGRRLGLHLCNRLNFTLIEIVNLKIKHIKTNTTRLENEESFMVQIYSPAFE
jgi:hypothetical protein